MRFVKTLFLLSAIVFSAAAQKREIRPKIMGQELQSKDGVFSFDKATQNEIAKIIMLSAHPVVKYLNGDSYYVTNNIRLSQIEELRFDFDWTANISTRVKFHLIWTGPQFQEEETGWKQAYYGIYGWNIYESSPYYWKKGIYKFIVIAEPQTSSSGAESTVECVFRLY